MGEAQRRALSARLAEDEEFRAAMATASTIADALRIARQHGVPLDEEDLDPTQDETLSDGELEAAGGGNSAFPCTQFPACTRPPYCV